MPVLSPHHTSTSYRSSGYNGTLDRPSYYTSGSYNPRITSYSERFTTRSYLDSDGRRTITRSGSITEDGVTSRFKDEIREGSIRRDSVSRDSGIGSIRENSISRRDRESSLGRESVASRMVDDLSDLRNKYSPANYVPAIHRNRNDNIARSKSINDIGLPPIEKAKKKVTVDQTADANNATNDNCSNNDDNGNRASVADLRKRFDKTPSPPDTKLKSKTIATKKRTGDEKATVKKIVGVHKEPEEQQIKSVANKKKSTNIQRAPQSDVDTSDVLLLKVNNTNDQVGTNEAVPTENSIGSSELTADESLVSRTNNFASYISSRDLEVNHAHEDDDAAETNKSAILEQKDLSSSPKSLIKSRASPPTGLPSVSSNSLGLKSIDRDESHDRPRSATDCNVKIIGLNGLKNIGNTCFMNSVIQCLSNTRDLLEYLRNDTYAREINKTNSSMKGSLIKAFAEVIKELWVDDSCNRAVNTASLKSQIQRFAPRFMGYAQQDAQEFLRYLLEGLHEDVNRVTERPKPIITEIDDRLTDVEKSTEAWNRYLRMDNSRIVDIFVGQLKSTLKCTYCGHCSVTFDPFWDLSLPVPSRSGQLRLTQCLDSFTKEETLDDDEKPTCSKCRERRKCTKSFSIQKLPKILVIHLKRFSPTERFRGKLNVSVDFPLEGLDMSKYVADGVTSCRYNLYAVSNHSGTTYSGHYTAYCRHPYALMWHEYNDSRVSSVSSRSVVSSEAYVLFYEQENQRSHL